MEMAAKFLRSVDRIRLKAEGSGARPDIANSAYRGFAAPNTPSSRRD
jgi:hypothetical protein